MKILRVIVNEMPEGCDKCRLVSSYANCVLTGYGVGYSTKTEDLLYATRPDWCPLESDYKESKRNTTEVEYRREHEGNFESESE